MSGNNPITHSLNHLHGLQLYLGLEIVYEKTNCDAIKPNPPKAKRCDDTKQEPRLTVKYLSPLFSRINLRPGKTYLYAVPRSASAGMVGRVGGRQ